MKKSFLLVLLVAFAPIFSFAQGCITVFSEDGDPFYLILNGVKQNSTPQTNVRVDGLHNDFYNAKIVFDDKSKEEIKKNIPTKDPATNQFAEVTYRLKKNNKGETVLRYFTSTPPQPSFTPPADMYVAHFGQAAPAASSASYDNTTTTDAPVQQGNSGGYSQTTTTTTTTTGSNGGINMNVQTPVGGLNMNVQTPVGGVSMNVNVNDPNIQVGSSTTTTTSYTTTSTSSTTNADMGYGAAPAGNNDNGNARQSGGTNCVNPMDFGSFNSAKESIKKASFEDTKLSTAKTILGANCVSTDQVVAICKMFSYEASKLEFAKFAYGKTTDRNNYFKVGDVFSFDASRTELNDYISSH